MTWSSLARGRLACQPSVGSITTTASATKSGALLAAFALIACASDGRVSTGAGTGGSATGVATGGSSGIGRYAGEGGHAIAGTNGNVAGGTAAGGLAGATGSAGTSGADGTSGAGGSTAIGGGGAMTGTAGSNQAGSGGTAAGVAGAAGATAGAAATCPSGATAKPGETTETLMVGGMSRTYVLHIPPGYDGKTPMPLIFDYHALGGTGSQQKGLSGWGTLADQKGIIVVWPDGVGNSWNVGRCCSTAQSQNVDDVGFTKAIISSLEQKACIDSKRIYATGCSNGGGMAYKVACDAADVIAAVAPVDFDCVTNSSATPSCGMCLPARPIPEIQFRGTSDTAVPYDGGSGPRGTVFPGAEENLSEWADINRCSGDPAPLDGHASCQAYDQCASGAETVLCTVQNGMHCGNYQSFGIINIAWEMFQRQALP